MSITKELGKIKSVRFGQGGYQDIQFGLFMTLGGDGWGVSAGIEGGWSLHVKCDDHCKWTEEDRTKNFGEAMGKINQLMIDAKVDDVMKLVGIPVEAEFENLRLKNWRVLKEVL